MRRSPFASTALIFFVASLFGCAASPAASTTTTAADVAQPAPREAAVDEAEREALPALPGRLECRATDTYGVTTELYLEWSGESATGNVRRITPSGMVSVRPVRAERHQGAVIADHPGEQDLTVHAAVVGQDQGKRVMRAGDANQAWSTCE